MQEGFAAEHGREVLGHPVRCAGLLSQLFVASIATVQTSILLLVLQRDYCTVLLIQATVTVRCQLLGSFRDPTTFKALLGLQHAGLRKTLI